jgi:hypothetical protein
MNDSIFTIKAIDRNVIRWEDHILDPSPVEKIGGLWFKREDKFAPLGYGGLNGSKCRVCIWLISEAVKAGAKGVIHGAVTGSPQHPMVASICRHFQIPTIDVIGTTKPEEHDMLAIAGEFGATFIKSNIGYARNLERIAYANKPEDFFVLETNITVDEKRNAPERIEAFHRVGSEQVREIPDEVETIIVPAGSCNSVLGVLYGIARFRPKGLKKVVLYGIGSWGSKDPAYIYRRLQIIGNVNQPDNPKYITDLFHWNFHNNQKQQPISIEAASYTIEHYNINDGCGACDLCMKVDRKGKSLGYCEYNDLMDFSYEDLNFHPRYESKVFHYMKDHLDEHRQYLNEKTLFWIIGGKVDLEVMRKYA